MTSQRPEWRAHAVPACASWPQGSSGVVGFDPLPHDSRAGQRFNAEIITAIALGQ